MSDTQTNTDMNAKEKPGFIKRWLKRLAIFTFIILLVGGLGIWYTYDQLKTPPTEWEQALAEQAELESGIQSVSLNASGNPLTNTPPVTTIKNVTFISSAVSPMANTNTTTKATNSKRKNTPTSAATVFERQFAASLSQIRPNDEPWKIGFTQIQANQWLAKRLHKWLTNQKKAHKLPQQVKRVMVHFSPKQVKLMLAWQQKGLEVIIWANTSTQVIDGKLNITVSRVGVGNLETAPATASMLGNAMPKEAIRFIETLSKPIELPEIDLADGRKVNVKNITIERGLLIATSTTHQKKKKK